MSATILSFPVRSDDADFSTTSEYQPDYDRVHRAMLHALRSVHALAVRQRYHQSIPSFAWGAIEDRQVCHSGGEFDISEFVNEQLGAFYEFSSGQAPVGWRLPDDPRQCEQAREHEVPIAIAGAR